MNFDALDVNFIRQAIPPTLKKNCYPADTVKHVQDPLSLTYEKIEIPSFRQRTENLH